MMQEPVHARLACDAARAVGLPFWLGVSCRTIGSNVVSYDFPDVALGDCLEPLLVYEPRAVNVMHTPPAAVLPALAEIKLRWSGPVGAYPESSNAERAAAPSPSRDVVSPPQLAALATQWLAAGARLLGGCCGTTPDHIRALRQLIGDPRNR
jgi:S-methylmethionine-dependent homocysteine/selenocysteine methylase